MQNSSALAPRRRDGRTRPGRGKLSLQANRAEKASSFQVRACYKVPVAQLPLPLRMKLPRWARYGIEQAEENRRGVPRRTHYCYVQPFLGATDELTEWRPESSHGLPSHYRVAATPDALCRAPCIEVDEQVSQVLVRELVNGATPSPLIRLAPACFLTEGMRALIAPGVSFPDGLLVPCIAAPRRVSLTSGNQVAIPQWVAKMPIEKLRLSETTLASLLQAGVTTVGALLELEEEHLIEFLESENLWELSTAVFANGVLPTRTGLLPAEQADEEVSAMAVFEVFYYYPTGISYDDEQLGRLYLVHAACFVDRLDGCRSGPVEALWLTRAQIGQSLIWKPEMERLDSLELRTRVTTHAVARGALLPHMKRAEDLQLLRKRQMLEMEEQYNRVPLRSEYKQDAPLELFISEADLKAAGEEHLSPSSTVIRVLERYLEHPQAQLAGHRLSVDTLEALHYWLREDGKQLRQLNAAWKRQFPGQPHPTGPSLVTHKEYAIRKYKEWNKATGRIEVKEIAELIGYRLIIGVLTGTRVPSDLIVEPCRGKLHFIAAKRPLRPGRTANSVSIPKAS